MYKEELDSALRSYDQIREQRNALAGKEETDELVQQREALDADLEVRSDRIAKLEERAAKEARLEETRQSAGVYTPVVTRARESELQAIVESRSTGAIAFNGAIETRAVNAGSGNNYGNATFQERLMFPVFKHNSVLLAGAFTYDDATGNLASGVQVDPVEGGPVSESTGLDETTSSTQARPFGAYVFGGIVKVSEDAVTDNAANLESLVARKGSQAVTDKLGGFLLTGTGTNQPQGALTGAQVGVTGSSTTGLTEADIYNLFYSLGNYADGSAWIMNAKTASLVRSLNSNWFINPANDSPASLLGCPLLIDSNMPDIASSAKSILFGNFTNGYTVRMVGGIEVRVLDQTYAAARQVGIRVTVRADGQVTEPNFIKVLQHPSS